MFISLSYTPIEPEQRTLLKCALHTHSGGTEAYNRLCCHL